MRFSIFSITAAAAVALSSSALSQEATRAAETPKIGPSGAELSGRLPENFVNNLARRPEAARKQMLDSFLNLANGGVVTEESLLRANQVERSIARAQELQRTHLVGDLDGDGAVTPAERNDAIGALDRRYAAQFVLFQQEADADGDGTVTMKEASAQADAKAKNNARSRRHLSPRSFLQFDLNEDGEITLEELFEGLDRIQDYRSGENGLTNRRKRATRTPATPRPTPTKSTPSTANTQGLPKRTAAPSVFRTQTAQGCTVPQPPDGAEIVLLSGYEGGALSTLAVAGQEREAEVTKVRIERGPRPLWILASAFTPMVWSLDGATERVAHFIVEGSVPTKGVREGQVAAAVAGLPAEKVRFLPKGACAGESWKTDPAEQRLFTVRAARRLGFEPTHVATRYTMGTVMLPSGRFEEPGDRQTSSVFRQGWGISATDGLVATGQQDDLQRQSTNTLMSLLRFSPGGVIAVDPTTVVADGPVEPFEVLPQQAGLLQLIQSGAIRQIDRESYVVEKPIPRFPAGLSGAHSVRFILAEGVPMPVGDAGHSTVVSAETGECLSGARCRR
ncbi:MAG: hypothetical protein AAFW01_02735 [Pseudomonadota bacterium]